MSRLEEAQGIIYRCEQELRGLVAAAASSGDYSEVLELTTLALKVGELRVSGATGRSNEAWQPDSGRGLVVGTTAQVEDTGSERAGAGRQRRDSRRAAAAARSYPTFLRAGDDLVKIGWSAKQRSEYQHRAPYPLLVKVGEALSQVPKRKLVRIEDVQKLSSSTARDAAPLYQLYVVVAWFKEIGVLDQSGRQGYAVVDARNLSTTIEGAWLRLGKA